MTEIADALEPNETADLVGINAQRLALRKRRQEMIDDHNAALKRIDAKIAHLVRIEGLLLGGLDLATVMRAERVLYVRGLANCSERMSCVESAVNDLATATDRLKREYFGTKNYDRWSDQRTDCEYGYRPRHGSIVFAVGLTDDARSRPGLTQQERNDAIYYLRNIARIQAAPSNAAPADPHARTPECRRGSRESHRHQIWPIAMERER